MNILIGTSTISILNVPSFDLVFDIVLLVDSLCYQSVGQQGPAPVKSNAPGYSPMEKDTHETIACARALSKSLDHAESDGAAELYIKLYSKSI